MALQTTGLEFFYLSVDFFENDKILLVEQELGSRATLLVLRLLARIYHKGYFCRWGKDECLLFTRRLPEGCTADYVQQVVMHYWNVAFLVKSNTKDLEFLLRKAYRAIILRRHNDGSV